MTTTNQPAALPPAAFEARPLGPDDPAYLPAQALVLCGAPRVNAGARRQIELLKELALLQDLCYDVLVGAFLGSRLITAALLVESPGRAAIVYVPQQSLTAGVARALPEVLAQINGSAAERGLRIVQVLLAPDDAQRERLFAAAGYTFIAELIYLDRPARATPAKFSVVNDLTFVAYPDADERRLVAALEATYHESLDCPGLTGLRDTADVLAGHRATGVYDPSAWFLAMRDDVAAGVLLLARVPGRSALEVVYMGVSAAHRGQGVGDALMARAIEEARARQVDVVTLAVDSINAPARRLYAKWQFTEMSRRRAWITAPQRA